ncbi:MAG TPA: type II toxin-antitoxin system death-on-curing family toxin [Candidatus Bathyarchaeia archaeon]|nr:type II toxin-antitoxin system death-on-curing family toxin [Candidatus Bathyarchaeia archaeon]
MKKIRYLSIAEAEWFHDRILDLTGGERGDLARANLEFALEKVRDIGEHLDRDKALVKKSAFLLYSLVVHHPFINGNKRTAFEVVSAFLELNGYTVRAGKEEIYRLLADIGSGNTSQTQVEQWIATNLAKKRNSP